MLKTHLNYNLSTFFASSVKPQLNAVNGPESTVWIQESVYQSSQGVRATTDVDSGNIIEASRTTQEQSQTAGAEDPMSVLYKVWRIQFGLFLTFPMD